MQNEKNRVEKLYYFYFILLHFTSDFEMQRKKKRSDTHASEAPKNSCLILINSRGLNP